MKRTALLSILGALLMSGRAEAANLAVMTSPPNLISAVVLVVAVSCLIIGYQVQSTVRGGLLSKGWQLFMAAFGLLAVSQLLMLLAATEVVVLPSFAAPAALVLMGICFLMGVLVTKKTLS